MREHRVRHRRSPTGDPAVAERLLHEVEARLEMGVVVSSVEPGPPARIHALLLFRGMQTEVVAAGPSEAEAWHDLAERAMAWRSSDAMSMPNWLGGGGAV